MNKREPGGNERETAAAAAPVEGASPVLPSCMGAAAARKASAGWAGGKPGGARGRVCWDGYRGSRGRPGAGCSSDEVGWTAFGSLKVDATGGSANMTESL